MEDAMRFIYAVLGRAALLIFSVAAACAADCDRTCLVTLADRYIAALAAHNPQNAPLSSSVRMVENAKRIRPGEGLWKTASAGAATEFKIVVPDPLSQQVGGIVVLQSEGKPAQVGFRLKLADGMIIEAEHLIAIPRSGELPAASKRVRPAIPMEIPYEYADSRGRLIHIAKSYYDAVDLNNSSLAPFASDCDRRENGSRTAPSGGPLSGPDIPGAAPRPIGLLGMIDCRSQIDMQTFEYITEISNRRVEIADEKTGLALGFSDFRHAMEKKQYRIVNDPGRETVERSYNPFDTLAMHIFKIWGGQLHEIEALGVVAPYNSPSGWE
jgi:hypothetical protein